LLAVFVYFLAYVLMAPMAWAELRTYNYILPLLCLGLAEWFRLALFGLSWPIRSAAIIGTICLASYLVIQLLGLSHPAEAAPRTWSFYYRGQGEIRQMVNETDNLVPDGALLLTWSYNINFTYLCLSERSGDALHLPSALDGLWMRYELGTLDDWQSRRHLDLKGHERIFLLVEQDTHAPSDQELQKAVRILLGPSVFAVRQNPTLTRVQHWDLSGSTPYFTILYEIVEG